MRRTGLIERRVGLLFGFFLVLLAVAGLRAAWLGIVRAGALGARAEHQQVADVEVPARRGTIRDRHGVELAVSESASDVAATPYLVKDPARTARLIAPVLGRDEPSVLRDLSRRDTGFVYLARSLRAPSARKLESLGLAGLSFEPASRRTYPQSFLAAQLLGAVGVDGDGLSGLEYSQDRRLRGSNGERRIVRDALGQPIELRDLRRAESGTGLQLTIDASIQERVEEVLQGVGEQYHPKGATATVTDPRTGQILALANWPRVDANDPGAAPDFAHQDRASGAAYEPGSTFKPFTVAGALEDGLVTPQTQFGLAPEIKVADRTIGENERRGFETLSTAQILSQSSNVGAITIGLKLGERRFDGWVRRFGFGSQTGSDLPGEASGIVPRLRDYSGSSIGNLPIGQGLAVTPLQLAAAYGALANGGTLIAPHVVQEVGDRPVPEPRGRRVLTTRTAAEIRDMLRGVVGPQGTAEVAAVPGYEIAGKTGTANKPDPATGGYSDTRYVASFVGFAPASSPRVLITVMVDEPHGDIYGGSVAAPAFQKIAGFVLPYLRVPPR
jgi:cell division protein FtsI (penicillin-binding protein 3)